MTDLDKGRNFVVQGAIVGAEILPAGAKVKKPKGARAMTAELDATLVAAPSTDKIKKTKKEKKEKPVKAEKPKKEKAAKAKEPKKEKAPKADKATKPKKPKKAAAAATAAPVYHVHVHVSSPDAPAGK